MGKIDIIDKLKLFLMEHSPIEEEFEVVYIMVELRKLLDRRNSSRKLEEFSLVRFHSDWVVHTKKDYITPSMREIMTKIENSLNIFPKDGNIDYLMLPDFKIELSKLLNVYKLPDSLVNNESHWMKFILALTSVLGDQPLINPTANVAEFRYIDISKEGVMATIDFRGSKKGESITLGFGV